MIIKKDIQLSNIDFLRTGQLWSFISFFEFDILFYGFFHSIVQCMRFCLISKLCMCDIWSSYKWKICKVAFLINIIPMYVFALYCFLVSYVWFARPHWVLRVRRSLDEHFPNRWIGRGGPIPWPARSPDVTLLDFIFWGFVKGRVFKTPVHDIEDLKQRIREATEAVNINMLTNTWKELLRRLKFLLKNNGIHIEVYKWWCFCNLMHMQDKLFLLLIQM